MAQAPVPATVPPQGLNRPPSIEFWILKPTTKIMKQTYLFDSKMKNWVAFWEVWDSLWTQKAAG